MEWGIGNVNLCFPYQHGKVGLFPASWSPSCLCQQVLNRAPCIVSPVQKNALSLMAKGTVDMLVSADLRL